MPIETLAAIVAEQTLEVAMGAVVTAIAVPKWSANQSSTRAGSTAIVSKSPGAWYGRKWAGLVVDAQEAYASRNKCAMTLAGILASMPDARVVSNLPGRVRLRVKHFRGKPQQAQATANALMSGQGIYQVKANARTGSLLIYYDRNAFHSLDALMEWLVAH